MHYTKFILKENFHKISKFSKFPRKSKLFPIMYEWGEVKKVPENKIGIRSFSWTGWEWILLETAGQLLGARIKVD